MYRSLPAWFGFLLAVVVALGAVGCGGNDPGQASGVVHAGPGMMGYAPAGGGEPVRSLAAARRQADRFAGHLGLHAGEVMEFTNGYYVELLDRGEQGATEVLVDSATGAVWIEYGPAMMWNTRYGMMGGYASRGGQAMTGGGMMGGGMTGGGMMGGGMTGGGMMGSDEGWRMKDGRFRGDPTWTAPSADARRARISASRATTIANRWLRANADGLSAREPDRFPGYFTLHTLRKGGIAGMLSVNASTGAAWYHWWHGRFVAMEE